MSNNASKSKEINKVYSSLLLNGGIECVPSNVRHPDLDVYGGARIRKTLCADGDTSIGGDTTLNGDTTILGNLMVFGNTIFTDLTVTDLHADNIDTEVITANCINLNIVKVESITSNIIVGNSITGVDGCFDTLVVKNDATIYGNLVINGNLTTIDTENVLIEDNKVLLNNGEIGAGITGGTSGFEIDRGTLDNYLVCFDESKPGLVAGTVGNTKCVGIIGENVGDGDLLVWNNTTNQLETTNNVIVDTLTTNGNTTVCGILNVDNINDKTGNITITSNVDIIGTLTFIGEMDGDVCGNVKTDNITPLVPGGNISVSANIDMNCRHISNVQSLVVDQIFSKNVIVSVEDSMVVCGNLQVKGDLLDGNGNAIVDMLQSQIDDLEQNTDVEMLQNQIDDLQLMVDDLFLMTTGGPEISVTNQLTSSILYGGSEVRPLFSIDALNQRDFIDWYPGGVSALTLFRANVTGTYCITMSGTNTCNHVTTVRTRYLDSSEVQYDTQVHFEPVNNDLRHFTIQFNRHMTATDLCRYTVVRAGAGLCSINPGTYMWVTVIPD